MNAIKRGCIEFLIVWGLCGFALCSYFAGKFEPPGDRYGGIAGGFLLSSAWGLLRNATADRRRRRILAAAGSGGPPRDGEVYAAVGILHPLRDPIRTPFQRKECLAYGYEVSYVRDYKVQTKRHRERVMVMGGLAMTPCAVKAAHGDIPILGFPIPMEFPEERHPLSEFRERVQEHLETATFDERAGINFSALFSQIRQIFSEDDGSHLYHWRSHPRTIDAALESSSTQIMEQYIPVGVSASVIGTYSGPKGGLIGDLNKGGLEVIPGTLDDGLRALARRSRNGIIGALFAAALGTAGVYGVLYAREHRSRDVVAAHRDRYVAGIKADDVAAVREAIEHGVDPNEADGEVHEAAAEARSKEMMLLLIRSGLDLNAPLKSGYSLLMRAVAQEDRERVALLLGYNADPNVIQTGWGITSLERAFDDGLEEIFGLLESRGARGTFVPLTGGSPNVEDDSAEMTALREYLAAFGSGDAARLEAITDRWPEDFFDSFKRGLYTGTQRCEPSIIRGRTDGKAASVVVSCSEPKESGEIWIYTLVNRGGSWKVRRTGWDEKRRWECPALNERGFCPLTKVTNE